MVKEEMIETLEQAITNLDLTGEFLTRSEICEITECAVNNLVKVKEELCREPALIEVPEFVAEWYEENKHDLDYKIWVYIYDFDSQDQSEFSKWANSILNNPIETLIRMKDGYTVAKEPEWIVKTSLNNYFLQFGDDDSSFMDSVLVMGICDKQQARKFMDKTKAEALATLIDGEVVPAEEEE